MIRVKPRQFVWFFSLLIMLQSLWLNKRLNLAFKRSPEVMRAMAERRQAERFAKISKPKIEEKLAKGGRFWLEPKKADFSDDFEIEVWASADTPIKRVDLRIFYSPMDLQALNLKEWQIDESVGLIKISKEFVKLKEGRFKFETLQFSPKAKGETELEFDFDKESMVDCNLINEDGEDILEEVGGGKYQINLKTQI